MKHASERILRRFLHVYEGPDDMCTACQQVCQEVAFNDMSLFDLETIKRGKWKKWAKNAERKEKSLITQTETTVTPKRHVVNESDDLLGKNKGNAYLV